MSFFLADDEAKKLSAVHAALEQHGVIAADSDYTVSTLAAAIYARRWSYSIDRSGPDFRATITSSDGNHRGIHSVGTSPTLEVALAFALDAALSANS